MNTQEASPTGDRVEVSFDGDSVYPGEIVGKATIDGVITHWIVRLDDWEEKRLDWECWIVSRVHIKPQGSNHGFPFQWTSDDDVPSETALARERATS